MWGMQGFGNTSQKNPVPFLEHKISTVLKTYQLMYICMDSEFDKNVPNYDIMLKELVHEARSRNYDQR